MAYDDPAKPLRQEVQGEQGVSEKRMFGGLAFLVHGNLAGSVRGEGAFYFG